jgi:type IX secretion system PorP/SprF family membrane protein
MKTTIKTLAIVLISLTGRQAFAQQDPLVSQYMFNQLFLNPAYAGSHLYPNASLLFRDQWVGYAGAPVTELLSMDGNLKNQNMGLGFTLVNDHIGVTNRTGLYGDYAYHLKLNDKMTLSMGLSGGADMYEAQLTSLTVWNPDDPVFASNIQSKLVPNFGTGLYLYGKDYYAGLSIPTMLSYKPNTFLYINMNDLPELQRTYYLTGGYTYVIDKNVSLKPSLLFEYINGAPVTVDFNLNALLDNKIYLGVSYRTGDDFIAMVEVYVSVNIRVGYAYDYPISAMSNVAAGSQEINISYDLGELAKQVGRPKF